ncbi:AfsR/SARP family transcriptional regulator [Actinoplanes utahensis]|uniref:AfsR/SARP family transcriptional regulator n=1 Tax=Actinoplanes utahensis TaxID=1869 RepID=UPI00068973CB|nr:BTAD domain-containing putative transcriptional regulator [Actinoplanes utahensis]GIF34180.1 SARP family transcriptional regulator [Actinoplanes utahensis]
MNDIEPAVRLRSYGGLRMWRSGAEVDIGAPRLRTLLATLLAARGGVVGVDTLIDLIWGAEPSPSAVNQLHRLVGQVRRLFEPQLASRAPGRWVQPAGQGYRLVADERTCDLMAVRSFLASARAASAAGLPREASQAYAQALERAHEPVFAGLDPEVLDHPAFVALQQERIQIAVEAADLALTEPAALRSVPQLHRIAVSAPLHEPLQARMVRLLALTGRRAEALVLFDEVRRLLADELGADPGAELRSAHLQALADDDPEPPAAHRPVQLPRRVAGFVTRGELPTADTGIVVLSGMGGIGKTALAVDWAHRLAPRYPDGQLYLNLRGFDPSGRLVEPSEALNVLLESLGVALVALAGADVDTRAARLRSALVGRRMILLLDNARDSEQVRPLLPGTSGCLVIVTSRNRMTGLIAHEGARPVMVGRLGDAAALELLAKRIGAPRLSAEPQAAGELVRFCAGLPLALAIAAAYAAVRPDMKLKDVVDELESSSRKLDALATGETSDDVRSALSWSYRALSPAAARMFRLLAVHPGPEISAEAAASIAGASDAARGLLIELSAANMITEAGRLRYTVHDLLHAYAGELLGERERLDAERRLVEHYLRSARHGYLVFGRPPLTDLGPVTQGVVVEEPADFNASLEWYIRERRALRAIVDLALARGWDREAIQIILDVRAQRSSRIEPPADSREQSERALAAAYRLGDPLLEAGMLRETALGIRAGQPDLAELRLRRALALYERIGDAGGQSHVWRNLVSCTRDPAERLRRARLTLDFARRSRDPCIVTYGLSALAGELRDHGDLAEAAAVGEEAFRFVFTHGIADLRCEAPAKLAEIHLLLDDPHTALRYIEIAVDQLAPADVFPMFHMYALWAEAADKVGDHARAAAAAARFHEITARHAADYRAIWGDTEVDEYTAKVTAISAPPMH